jgi:hypothetical protein
VGVRIRHTIAAALGALLLACGGAALAAGGAETAQKVTYKTHPPAPRVQTPAEADAKTQGCMTCHTATDS